MRLNLSKTKDFIETTDNPFEDNKSYLQNTEYRITHRRKGKKRKSRFRMGEH